MNHDAYEKQMIDGVNHHAEDNIKYVKTNIRKESVVTKEDTAALKTGFKRTLISLITIILFSLSACGFVAVATARGYLAVVLFIVSIVVMGLAFSFLYAQGLASAESSGDKK